MFAVVSAAKSFTIRYIPPLKMLSNPYPCIISPLHSTPNSTTAASSHKKPLSLKVLGFRDAPPSTKKKKNNSSLDENRIPLATAVPPTFSKPSKKSVSMKKISTPPLVTPKNSFSELGIPPSLVERLANEGFIAPTDVQSTAIPILLKNHDAVIQSYTGSGKTLAYVLPILTCIASMKSQSTSGSPISKKRDLEAVIVVPSRELGMQIVREIERLLGPDDRKMVQQLVGGANPSRQEEALRKNKPVIVVGTPGRIADISIAGRLRAHACRYLVLDEVDVLLASNFRLDMMRILDYVGRRRKNSAVSYSSSLSSSDPLVYRQTIMVSATVPFSLVRAARSWGFDPLLVQAKNVAPIESFVSAAPKITDVVSSNTCSMLVGTAEDVLPPSLEHYYCVCRSIHKVDTLRKCIHALDAKFVIVFMNRPEQLKDTVFKLQARGMDAVQLHGDLGKLSRSTAMAKFKGGDVRVLVTNELSARGLDVAECDLVVNMDLPSDPSHYAHRAGRAARLGRHGVVLTLCEPFEAFVVKKFRKQLGVRIEGCDFKEGKLVVLEDKKRGLAMEMK